LRSGRYALGGTTGTGDNPSPLMTLNWAGQLFTSGGIGSPSDASLKDNIEPAAAFDSLAAIRALVSKAFDWKSDSRHQPFGFIASDVREVLPDVVTRNRDIEYLDLTALLVHAIRAIQQLAERMEAHV